MTKEKYEEAVECLSRHYSDERGEDDSIFLLSEKNLFVTDEPASYRYSQNTLWIIDNRTIKEKKIERGVIRSRVTDEITEVIEDEEGCNIKTSEITCDEWERLENTEAWINAEKEVTREIIADDLVTELGSLLD